jgi:hypothetical protein
MFGGYIVKMLLVVFSAGAISEGVGDEKMCRDFIGG